MNITSIGQKKRSMHQHISDVKFIFSEMNKSRRKEIEFFTKTFENIVKNHKEGINGAEGWPKPFSIFDITSEVSNPNFKVQVSILKKLFFNDLLFHYYDFCYRMNDQFSELNNKCKQKLDKIIELSTKVRKLKKLPGNELNWYSLYELISKDLNTFHLFDEFKSIMFENLRLRNFQINDFFYTDSKIHFGNKSRLCDTYKIINYFLKNYNTSILNNEKSCLESQNIIDVFKKEALLNFEENYLDFITLDITKEYEKRVRLPEDTRFKKYIKSLNIINNCDDCRQYCKNMLKNVLCDTNSHQNILREIRAEFFGFMEDSWFSDSILLNKSIYERISTLYNHSLSIR